MQSRFLLSGLLSILLLTGCASSRTGTALNVGLVGAGVADLVSTQRAMGRGAVEANPLMGQTTWQQVAVKTAGVGTIMALTRLIEHREHPILAHVLRGAAMVGWSLVAVHNTGVNRWSR